MTASLPNADQLRQQWASDTRWAGIERPYTAEDVVRLRGSVAVEHSLARRRTTSSAVYGRSIPAQRGSLAHCWRSWSAVGSGAVMAVSSWWALAGFCRSGFSRDRGVAWLRWSGVRG